ncbi:MAG TPA: rhombosortase [Methylibium sp.]|nr:rhombosortase [Methylibium sp.]
MPSSADAPRPGRAAWALLGALLLLPAWIAYGRPTATAVLAWQAATVGSEPWRLWSAAWVHLSALHLAANSVGALGVIALGVAARVSWRATLAWALAWPLTHAALGLAPELARYGGLSGVLHAGVAVVAVVLWLRADRRERRLGLAIAAGLLLKIGLEAPWRTAVAHPEGWDIAVAPLAHAAGVASGALLAWALCGPRLPSTRPGRT